MKNLSSYIYIGIISIVVASCGVPDVAIRDVNDTVPEQYAVSSDSTNSADVSWKTFFTDSNLVALIDTALVNNQELNIMMQEIMVSQTEVQTRKGEYLPFVDLNAGGGVDKVSRYTRNGALEANNEIVPGEEFPEPLGDMILSANASWEIDIWRKLRNGRDAAISRYLGSIEGKNFMVTNLVAEISSSYYELMALDNKLQILNRNIEIQKNALEIVKMQKQAAKATELAVKKFEAEVFKNQSHIYEIQQDIVETENKINFLVGRFPQPIQRSSVAFNDLLPDTVLIGVPAQLMENRPDVKRAELELVAAKLDVKVARANFYPSLKITAAIGSQSFDPEYFIRMPQSLLYSMAGELAAPLINRKAIKAQYSAASSKQLQAIYDYERTVLNAYIEVSNQLSNIGNLEGSYEMKGKQVDALTQSISISTNLFKSARADYMEVLMTQRDALEAKLELIETKQQQMVAMVNMYRALGGGWF